jgi:DNA-binding GntR family transcriptional regulator
MAKIATSEPSLRADTRTSAVKGRSQMQRKPAQLTGPLRQSKDAVFEALRLRIASHLLPPGSKLRESQLAAEFKVSRTRIRDVLGALEQRGLIERIPNRGAIVSKLDLKEASDLYDVREYLEALCVRRATLKAPDGAWDDLIPKIEGLTGRELSDDEFDVYLAYLEELRNRMISYADNPLLGYMLDLIYDKSQVIARRVIILPGRSLIALKLHHSLLVAMRDRDPDIAEKLRRQILSSAKEMLEKYRRFVL